MSRQREPRTGLSRREVLRGAGLVLGAASLGRVVSPAAAAGAAPTAEAAARMRAAERLQLAVVHPQTAAQAAALAAFDDTHAVRDGGIEVLLWPGDPARLDAVGAPYEITVRDVLARDRARLSGAVGVGAPPPGGKTNYRTLPEVDGELQALAAAHPARARVFQLPYPSLEGRPVHGIEIGDDIAAEDGRPVAYVDGIHHAREFPAAEHPMIFAHYLLDNYGKLDRVTALLRNARVAIVPVVNVDGFNYARGWYGTLLDQSLLGMVVGGQGAYWRKNRRGNPVTGQVHQANPLAYGVDPNRNYPYLWGATTGGLAGVPLYASTSPNPFDQTYYGTDALSEPETRNVAEYLLSRNVTAMVTNHTYGGQVLRPWGHTHDDPPDEALLEALGARMAKALGNYQNIKGIGLSPTTGTTDDWYYAAACAVGYTIEHGTSGFHPPYMGSDGPGKRWPGAVEAFMLLSEAAADPAKHAVLRGRVVDAAGDPVPGAALNLHKEFDTPMSPAGTSGVGPLLARKNVTPEVIDLNLGTARDGTFEWHLNPSTRPQELDAGKTESYRLTTKTDQGERVAEIVLRRDEVLDLGDVIVGRTAG